MQIEVFAFQGGERDPEINATFLRPGMESLGLEWIICPSPLAISAIYMN